MKLLIVILLVVCVDLILGSIFDNKAYMNTPQKFCGSALSAEMSIICQGRYNEDKRSQRPKTKRGIVDDCCTIPCTRRYLKDYYCGPEPETTTSKIVVTTDSTKALSPVDYSTYYYALIGRVLVDYPKDYPRYRMGTN